MEFKFRNEAQTCRCLNRRCPCNSCRLMEFKWCNNEFIINRPSKTQEKVHMQAAEERN